MALTAEQKRQMMFRQVFCRSEWGPQVLNYLLSDFGFFDAVDPADAGAVALRNYGSKLLALVGAIDPADTLPLTRAILNVPPAVMPEDE
jgi:hypothetical protein